MKITAKLLDDKKASAAELPLSVSKVKTFDDCKAKYRYTYIEKLPRKEWSFHIFGSFLHLVLEEFHGMSGKENGALIPHPHWAKIQRSHAEWRKTGI